jgi:hypothetical protein
MLQVWSRGQCLLLGVNLHVPPMQALSVQSMPSKQSSAVQQAWHVLLQQSWPAPQP